MNETLLTEYKAAQDSISHYEKMIWTIGSISNALMVALIGTFVKPDNPATILVAFVVSVILYSLWWLFEFRYRQINISKFRRLWEIEKELNMNHHLKVKSDDKLRKFKPRADILITSICIFVPLSFLIYYLYLII
jgi:hypothetical protein